MPGVNEEVKWTSLVDFGGESDGDWKVEMPFQIFDNGYYVGDEHVSAYLITTSGGMVLIDTTTATTVNRTLDNIRKLGFDPNDIDYVFVTHAHDVHYGGGGRIKAETGATICMGAADWDFLEQAGANAGDHEYDYTTMVAPPETTRARMARSSRWASRGSCCTSRQGTRRERLRSNTSPTTVTRTIVC